MPASTSTFRSALLPYCLGRCEKSVLWGCRVGRGLIGAAIAGFRHVSLGKQKAEMAITEAYASITEAYASITEAYASITEA